MGELMVKALWKYSSLTFGALYAYTNSSNTSQEALSYFEWDPPIIGDQCWCFLEGNTPFFFCIKNYPPLVLKLKWTIYTIIQYYNEYCIAMSNDCSPSF